MKKLISINHKFIEMSPEEIVFAAKENNIDGFEIAFEYGNIEKEWFESFVKLCFKDNLIIQFHTNSELDINKQIDLCSYIFDVLYQYGAFPKIVVHPQKSTNKELAIQETIDYFSDLVNIFPTTNFTLENLNNIDIYKNRLTLDDIIKIVKDNNWNMTYDIGHEISDNVKSVSPIPLENINNVHIHSFIGNGLEKIDHQPISKNDEHSSELLEKIRFLKNGKYDETVVFEFDLYNCGNKNDALLQKYISYILAVNNFWQKI